MLPFDSHSDDSSAHNYFGFSCEWIHFNSLINIRWLRAATANNQNSLSVRIQENHPRLTFSIHTTVTCLAGAEHSSTNTIVVFGFPKIPWNSCAPTFFQLLRKTKITLSIIKMPFIHFFWSINFLLYGVRSLTHTHPPIHNDSNSKSVGEATGSPVPSSLYMIIPFHSSILPLELGTD